MSHPYWFEVIDGYKVVCTWCGQRFLSRKGLNQHWALNLRCKRNRNVNNQTQTKYNIVESDDQPSGE